MLAQADAGGTLFLLVVLLAGAWWFFKLIGAFNGFAPGFWSGFWTRLFVGTLRSPTGSGWLERFFKIIMGIFVFLAGMALLGLLAGSGD